MAHNIQKNEQNLDGKVLYISQPQMKTEKLTLRILVLQAFENDWPKPVPFVFKNARMDDLKDIKEGDWVNVQYQSLGYKGKSEGEPKYYAENVGVNCIKG